MPRVVWPLQGGRPSLQVVLNLSPTGQAVYRTLLADTGAGAQFGPFQLVLEEDDCLQCGGSPDQPVKLRGAYSGSFPTYAIRVRIPQLSFDRIVLAVGVPSVPAGFDGIACFAFLNRFAYGNFGNAGRFGLEN